MLVTITSRIGIHDHSVEHSRRGESCTPGRRGFYDEDSIRYDSSISRSNRILEIADVPSVAGATLVAWEEHAQTNLELFSYSAIVIVPSLGTDKLQRRLLGRLRSEAHLGRWRAIWVLNEHVIEEVAEPCGIGKLERRNLSNGIVSSAFATLQPVASQIRVVPEELAAGTIAIAHWRADASAPQVPIAALSSNLRWAVTPPASDLSALIQLSANTYRGTFAAAVAVLLAAILALGWFGQSKASTAYFDGTAELESFDMHSELGQLARPDPATLPAARLAERLIAVRRSLNMLRATAKEAAGSPLSPEELRAQSQLPAGIRSQAYFRLALLTGDLASAYRIVLNTDFQSQDRHHWSSMLTGTLWQTAVESLQELDFWRAHAFTELYLESLDQVYRIPNEYGGYEPERNRTLARILLRESKSGRLKSLCNEPALAWNFGRLLGGSTWGYRLQPVSSREREKRIEKNREEQCANVDPALRASYDALVKTDQFYEPVENPTNDFSDLAQLVPLEYKYLRAREYITDAHSDEAVADGLKALLEIAQKPSYLAADALSTALDYIHSAEPKVSVVDVDRALVVISQTGGDYVHEAQRQIMRADCDRFDWSGFRGAASTTMKEVGARCGH